MSGLIGAEEVKDSSRPEKRVYRAGRQGIEKFGCMLKESLELTYRPTFPVDGALFFSDAVDTGTFAKALEAYAGKLKKSLERIRLHRGEVVPCLPPRMQAAADLIFTHHQLHYEAELAWANSAIACMKEEGQ